jgi:hypothetical protein
MSDFYIGYLPKAPTSLAHIIRRTVLALFAVAIMLALVLVIAQQPFAASVFEFGNDRSFEGTIEEQPVAALLVSRPGEASPRFSRYLLVARGKHGASPEITGLHGKRVRLEGSLIYRGSDTALELRQGSIAVVDAVPAPTEPEVEIGEVTLSGEIVDSKCFLGVMNPGSGKVHRDCAARCISGGIPAALVVKKGSRQGLYLLTDTGGRPLSRDLLSSVAEPLTLSGTLVQRGSTLILRVSQPVQLSRSSG